MAGAGSDRVPEVACSSFSCCPIFSCTQPAQTPAMRTDAPPIAPAETLEFSARTRPPYLTARGAVMAPRLSSFCLDSSV